MKVPVVDENGDIVGTEDRETVHKKGILHPTVHIIMKLPNGNFVFQRRSPSKDTNPNMLTYAAGGHVELDQTIEEAALKELEEETGIQEKIENLSYLGKFIFRYYDDKTGHDVHDFKYFFGYNFAGGIAELKIEEKAGAGFEEYSFFQLLELPEDKRKSFGRSIFSEDGLMMFKKFLNYEDQN